MTKESQLEQTAKEPKQLQQMQEKLDAIVAEFKQSLTPLEDTIKTVKGMSDTLSIGIGALNRKVLDLSQDVGSLKDLVDSNKGLSDKVEELTKAGGALENMPSNILTILTKPDGELNKLIDKYFSELMEEGPPVKAISVSFDSHVPMDGYQFIE